MRTLKAPRVKLAVTDELIAEATKEDSSHCMIADAVRAALPYARGVSVDIQLIRFSDWQNRVRYAYLTPRLAQEALVKFDAGEKVEPFRCELRDPHISAMNTPRSQRSRAPRTEAQEKAFAETRSRLPRSHGGSPGRGARPKIVGNSKIKPGPNGGGQPVPHLEGGQLPPTAALASGKGKIPAGRRRQYGIRALDRGSSLLLSDKGE
jgi:hypothetical protein